MEEICWKDCTLDELIAEIERNLELNSYKAKMAALCGSVGVSLNAYSALMETVDEINASNIDKRDNWTHLVSTVESGLKDRFKR